MCLFLYCKMVRILNKIQIVANFSGPEFKYYDFLSLTPCIKNFVSSINLTIKKFTVV